MTATPTLTTDLKREVLVLEDDLRKRLESITHTNDAGNTPKQVWQAAHRDALGRGRTSSSWVAWRDDRITQAAVGWVLTTVFVRFCEDNALVAPVWITGPGPRRQEALDAELAFYRERSAAGQDVTAREWLRQAVDHLASLPSTAGLVDEHAALRLLSPSGAAAEKLVQFWRQRDNAGDLRHDLADPTLSTRFLGDLYQDLSEHAKATYALLQTPVFVEEFILDRTLEPALNERPIEGFRMIDPTCGSGHFLLGAFDRLLDRWQRHAPGLEKQAMVQEALNAVHGVDLNPFAVAIARFRLTLAALRACGLISLEDAPAFRFRLATGDSLLHGSEQHEIDLGAQFDRDAGLAGFVYATEDLAQLRAILEPRSYDAVVGNPPYITVKDKSLNAAYRLLYPSCKGTYALTVPFMERFFGLAKTDASGQRAGWVGQITSNSFMKREFGSKLVEEFLVNRDLRLVIDADGAWIPGHNSDGTPTVIIVGRNQRPVIQTVRAVLSKGKRETRMDGSEGNGPYWRTIIEHLDAPGWDDCWVTVANLDRKALNHHPWSLTGGGAADLRTRLERPANPRLDLKITRVGFFADSHADDVFFQPRRIIESLGLPGAHAREANRGEDIRDWCASGDEAAIFPYDERRELVDVESLGAGALRFLWRSRVLLAGRSTFGGGTYASDGRRWWAWHQLPKDINSSSLAIAFAEVSTHNNFVLDRIGKVFNRTAPVIKLPAGSTVNDHLALVGVLNSSTACFWLKQRCKAKGGAAGHFWARTYQYNGTNVEDYPLPPVLPLERGRLLDSLAKRLAELSPEAVVTQGVPTAETLASDRAESTRLRAEMVAVQEELDWEVYRLYGLVPDNLTYTGPGLPALALGERVFEIALARRFAAGEEETAWFTRHGSTPITGLPEHWPAAYRELVQRRLDLIATDTSIRLLEKPEHKRRWASEPWEKRQERALRGWLLDRLEDTRFWYDTQNRPTPRSVAQLADDVARDHDLVSVLALWEGRPDVAVTQSLVRLLADEAVPYLAAYRYKDSGMRKREVWEQTWTLQRREDSGEPLTEPIPLPPKYVGADFRKTSYWQARGKLDVPKERFILYPDAGRDTDPTPLLGWAGWDDAQQALALNLVIAARDEDGWTEDRLVPLVAGLAELQPWVRQWHSELDASYGVSLADFCAEQLTLRSAQVAKSPEELAAWRPAPTTRGRKKKTA